MKRRLGKRMEENKEVNKKKKEILNKCEAVWVVVKKIAFMWKEDIIL